MQGSKTHLRTIKILSIVTVLVIGASWASMHTSTAGKQGQGKERLLEKGTFRKEPMKVVGIKAKGKQVESGKRFIEEDDWINNLTIRLKNVSGKPIIFFEVSLTFPANADQPYGPQPGYVRDIQYGSEPLSGAAGSPNQPPPVMPNDFVELTLSVEDQEAIESALTRLDFPKGIYVKMVLRTVMFADDTMWRAGETLTRDPEDPSTWKVVPRAPGGLSSKRRTPEPNAPAPLSSLIAPPVERPAGVQRFAHVRSPPPQLPVCSNARYNGTSNLACTSASGCTVKKDHVINDIFYSIIIDIVFEDCKNSSGGLCKDGFFPIQQLTERTDTCPWIAGQCNGPANWPTYPSSGCITGLFFQGPCTRTSAFISKCDEYEESTCSCTGGFMSPIVIDVDRSGFSMTDADGGVVFNFLNDGVPLAISWTAQGSTNAFLVLDRNGNGTIDNGEELFGDVTPQPPSSEPNGFLALAVYDASASGGNGNGRIDSGDAIFSHLRLWQDANHNALSEPNELHTTGALGISGIDLNYKQSKKTDAHGNNFRYRARVFDASGTHAGKWAWDVFLTFQ